MLDKIRKFFRTSSRVHLRKTEIGSLSQALEVIDRFIDGTPREPLEWDDFVSWENANPGVEKVRRRVAALEREFFSDNPEEKQQACLKLVAIRNEVAALIGVQQRDVRPHETTTS